MTRALLAPLEPLYAAVVRARNARYDAAALERLRWPVVSIGNLSVGGSGKTPLVIRLAQLLRREGFSPDVLSRGYGRAGRGTERVDPQGKADRFGDEPLLIAQATGSLVFVGASRYEAGRLAEREAVDGGRHVHLLDDGFQHRQLARAVDIVLVQASDLQDRLLPAGRLREPLESLKRADVIVLRQEDAEIEARLRRYTRDQCPFWRVRRRLAPAKAGRAVAFCAIARPAEFFLALEAAGTEVVDRASFRDHHLYTPREIEKLAALGQRHGCDEFVTTEKDAVRLDSELKRKLTKIAPLRTAQLLVEIENEEAVLNQLCAMLAPDDA